MTNPIVPDDPLKPQQQSLQGGEPTTPPDPYDPFAPENLRLSQDFASQIGVRKLITVIPCRKPNRQEFIRVRPGEDWRIETSVYEDKLHREMYLVAPAIAYELIGEVYPACLCLATNRQGDIFLWPIRLPGADNRSNPWNESARTAAEQAETRWVRVASNIMSGMYDVYEAAGELSEPTWPDLSLRDIIHRCFGSRYIQSPDHPTIRALHGVV